MFWRQPNCRGQATVETALALLVGIVPLTLALLGFAEIAWTYHALATLTRQGAQYAATHCFQDDTGSNVVNWVTLNAPAFPDRAMLGNGITIQVQYWTTDFAHQTTGQVLCAASCSSQCVPDAVTVSVVPTDVYSFNRFFRYFGFGSLQVPSFSTTVEMQGSGANPETGESLP